MAPATAPGAPPQPWWVNVDPANHVDEDVQPRWRPPAWQTALGDAAREVERETPGTAGVDDDGLVAQLARLSQLHKDGGLTDAEFAAAKAKLLGTSA